MTGSILLTQAVCAIVSAKWAMELKFSQAGQLLWGGAALFGGPLVLLLLYVRQLYQRNDARRIERELSRVMAEDL